MRRRRYKDDWWYGRYDAYGYRKRQSWPRIIVLLVLIAAGVYILRERFKQEPTLPLPVLTSEVPIATPTPSALSYSLIAEDAVERGELSAAMKAYENLIALEPTNLEAYIALARLYSLTGRPERGFDLMRHVLRLQADHAGAWSTLALAYDWMYVLDDAIQAGQKAVALAPDDASAHAHLAEAYADSRRWYEASQAVERALALDPQEIDALRVNAYTLEAQGFFYEALDGYSTALNVAPTFVPLLIARGRVATAVGNYTLARESYQQAVEADPLNAEALDMLGWTYLASEAYDDAETYFRRALEAYPTYYQAHGHMGTLYFQKRNYEEAIPAYAQAVRYGEAESRRKTAYILITLEDTATLGGQPAGEVVARGDFSHPRNPEGPLRAFITGERGAIATVRGTARLDVLTGMYTLNLDGLPRTPEGKAYVAWFVRLRMPDRNLVRTVITPDASGKVAFSGETGPVRGVPIEYYYTLGLCHYFLAQCEKAEPYLNVALAIDPNDANAQQIWKLCHP